MTRPDPRPTDGSTDAGEPTWHWLCADEAGIAVSEPTPSFTSQQAAEDWLREQFEELADDGVAAVTLMDGERAVYGPMYLTADGNGPAAEAEL
jgi:hypothetical protein